jgi:hypothetical protein
VTLINSVIHSNNGKAGAPLDCEKGDVVLRDSVFKNNTWADSILSHICVRDNDDPLTNGGSYVLCDLYERVYFCDNWISIYEVDQYTTEPPISNTNCEDYGIVNKTHPRCLAL